MLVDSGVLNHGSQLDPGCRNSGAVRDPPTDAMAGLSRPDFRAVRELHAGLELEIAKVSQL